MISIAGARSRSGPVPGHRNAASLGLPAREAAQAMTVAIGNWRQGQASPAAYDQAVTDSRRLYARLVGVPAEQIAVGSQRSQICSILAEPKPLDERIQQISAFFFRSPEELEDWSLLFVELWLQAMREPSLRSRMEQVHAGSPTEPNFSRHAKRHRPDNARQHRGGRDRDWR